MTDKLVYINRLGPNYKGNYNYEFLFAKNTDCENDTWEDNGKGEPPLTDFITAVGTVTDVGTYLELIQFNREFNLLDAKDGIVALGWTDEDEEDAPLPYKRLAFHFGHDADTVKTKWYERGIDIEINTIKPVAKR